MSTVPIFPFSIDQLQDMKHALVFNFFIQFYDVKQKSTECTDKYTNFRHVNS